VVDYLQLFQGKAGKDYGSENLVMLLNDVSAAIVRLKKELPVTFLMAGQENTNRERSEKDRKPLLSDFKDSQKPPADADLVAFLADVDMSRALRDQGSKDEAKREVAAAMLSWLEAPPVQALPSELRGTDRNQDSWWGHHLKRVNLYVAKQRNGPTGDCQLVMVRPWMRFLDVRVTAEEAGKRASQRDLTIAPEDSDWGNEEPTP
jgi:replicative DNA helicase